MNKRVRSVTRARKYFAVDPSPFNVVKLALGVIMVVGALLGLVTSRLAVSSMTQVLVLSSYGVIAALWLIAKTRQVVQAQVHHSLTGDEKSPVNNSLEK